MNISGGTRQLITGLLRWPMPPESSRVVESILDGEVDWPSFVATVRVLSLEATVFANLNAHFSGLLQPSLRLQFTNLEKEARARTLGRALLLGPLVNELAAAGIAALVIKGPAFAVTAYGDVTRRASGDIDLLIDPVSLKSAREVVVGLGYTPTYAASEEDGLIRTRNALEFMRPTSKVDLHGDLFEAHLVMPTDLDDIWASAMTIECAGTKVRTMSMRHAFMYACTHGAKHQWRDLRWIADVAQLAQFLSPGDMEFVIRNAVQNTWMRTLRLAVQLAADVTGFLGPTVPADLLEPDRWTLARRNQIRFSLGLDSDPRHRPVSWRDSQFGDLYSWIEGRDDFATRVAIVRSVILPPRFGHVSLDPEMASPNPAGRIS